MTNNTEAFPAGSGNSLGQRIGRPAATGWTLLILVTQYVCYFSHLGTIGLVGPDEPRYAWIARAMVETGDWVTPRLYGRPWFEKPVLYYWSAAASFKLFGVNEVAARLPSAVFALLATLALAWLAWRLYGAATARWLLVLLPSCVGMIGFSHAASTDMPFSAMLTMAMVAAAVIMRIVPASSSEVTSSSFASLFSSPSFASLLFGFFLGLAVLAKGPAAIILCGGTVFFWALFTRRWRDPLRLFHPVGVVTFCLTALPWYILCAHRNPDFFRVFIIEHNFKRFLTPEFQHTQPFWFYLPVALVALFPWTIFLIGVVKDWMRAAQHSALQTFPDLYFGCWALFTILFFTISKSKLPGYILPAIPPLILLAANAVSLRMRRIVSGARWMGFAGAFLFLALSVGMLGGIEKIPAVENIPPPSPVFLILLVDLLVGITALMLALRWRNVASLILVNLALQFTFLVGIRGNVGYLLDLELSTRADFYLPHSIGFDLRFPQAVTYQLPRSYVYSLNFYMHRELPEWDRDATKPVWVFTTPKELTNMNKLGMACPPVLNSPHVIACEPQLLLPKGSL